MFWAIVSILVSLLAFVVAGYFYRYVKSLPTANQKLEDIGSLVKHQAIFGTTDVTTWGLCRCILVKLLNIVPALHAKMLKVVVRSCLGKYRQAKHISLVNHLLRTRSFGAGNADLPWLISS